MSGHVAVTGATGFIGWHVCERLRDAGWSVTAIVRPESRKPLPEGVERIAVDLDTTALKLACRHIGTIVHVAGITRAGSSGEYRHVNVDGTRAVAEAARALQARMVHVSSLTAAGPAAAERPRTEADASTPITDYGVSKLEAEAVLRGMSGLRWTMVRPAAVYGPRDRQFLPLFQAARRGLFLRLPNATVFSLTLVHVDDLSRAIERVCGSAAVDGETLFIGHGAPVSIDDLFTALAVTFNRTYRAFPVPFALLRVGAWLGVGGLSVERLRELMSVGFVCSVARAEQRLGFRAAIDLAEGCRSTAAWYRANRWL